MKSDAIFQQFKKDHQFKLEPKTLKTYQCAVNQLVSSVKKPIDEIVKKDIRNFLTHLSESGYKPNSINSKLIGLKSFFNYCWEEGWVTKNPAKDIPFPKWEESIPHYLTREQLSQLRELVKGNLLERALIETLYATGIRISELQAMKRADINWSERSILIPEGKGKKERIVLFTPACAEYIKAYLESRKDDLPFVFVNALADTSIRIPRVNEKFQSFSKQLGFYVSPHLLRHTFAAHLAQKGMRFEGIQLLLGHDDPKTTQVYTRLYNHAQKEMYDKLM